MAVHSRMPEDLTQDWPSLPVKEPRATRRENESNTTPPPRIPFETRTLRYAFGKIYLHLDIYEVRVPLLRSWFQVLVMAKSLLLGSAVLGGASAFVAPGPAGALRGASHGAQGQQPKGSAAPVAAAAAAAALATGAAAVRRQARTARRANPRAEKLRTMEKTVQAFSSKLCKDIFKYLVKKPIFF